MIVEDGTGLADADAFISVADAETYLNARGFTAFAAMTLDQKQAAIINASEFLSTSFGYIGARKSVDQALAWPRVAIAGQGLRVPANIPRAVAIAVARVANAAASGSELFASVSGGDLITRVQAGSVAVDFNDMAARISTTGRASLPWLRDLLGYLATDGPPDPTHSNGMCSQEVERA